jgi:AraC family transcriptional regulator
MSPVRKALWYIESHIAEDVALEDVARASGVTRHHLVRSFGYAVGCSVMRYVRARRLSEAAKTLATGAPDILTVALDAGYNSHEAFTRAFGDQFLKPPETVRADRTTPVKNFWEPIKMDEDYLEDLAEPRIEMGRVMIVAGLEHRYSPDTIAGIPGLWQKFAPHIGQVDGQVGFVTYGVCRNADEDGGIDYLAGVEIRDGADLPDGFVTIKLAARRYAVFTHGDHISTIRRTVRTIWNKWLPESDFKIADAPDFERYGEDFDGQTGMGGVEIWAPIEG